MPDPGDMAKARLEADLEISLQQRRPTGPQPTGFCLNEDCEEELEGDKRWCDASCRDQWERARKQRAQQVA